ncbi:MAG: hypothetical protein OEV59_00150 [Deltaproteobacteria bacterium]|nr:hypothetical protein [Deltaproteobacteria bacterium]
MRGNYHILKAVILSAVAAAFFGCAAAPYKQSYETAVKANDYGEAYKILKEVCPKNPKEPLCEKMPKVRAIYGGQLMTTLTEKIEKGEKPFPLGAIKGLRDEVSLIAEVSPKADLSKINAAISDAEKETNKAVTKKIKEGEKLYGSNDVRGAFDAYKSAVTLDEGQKPALSEFAAKASAALLEAASKASAIEDWKTARKTYEDVLYIDASNSAASSAIDEAREKDSFEYAVKKGDEAAAANKYDEAFRFYDFAAKYDNAGDIKAKITAAKVNAANYFFTEGEDLFDSGSPLFAGYWFVKAVGMYKQVPASKRGGVNKPSQTINKLLDSLISKTKTSIGAGDYISAYPYIETAYNIQSDYGDTAQLRDKVRDEVKRRALSTVAVRPFTGPSGDESAGRFFTTKITDFFIKDMATDVNVVERGAALSDIVKESEVKALQGGESGENAMKFVDADYMLVGDISDYKVESKESKMSKMVRGKTGMTQTRNPAYDEWQKKKEGPEPTKYRDTPVYEDVKVDGVRYKKTAFVSVGYKVVDTEKARGIVLYSGLIEKKKDVSDESSDSVNLGEFVIEAKIANLPSDGELLNTARSEAVEDLKADLRKIFASMDVKLVAEAEKLREKKNYKGALDKLVRAYFIALKKSADTSAIEEAINSVISDGRL